MHNEKDLTNPNSKIHDIVSTYIKKAANFPKNTIKILWKLGKDDPKRVIHSIKVGISITLVSLLYLLEPLSKEIGENAIWAVMTVLLVLQFTAGATLCKGFNRGLGTLLAGSLAFLFEFIATESDHMFHAVFIASAVFFIGTVATYMRFLPSIKKNFDYGVIIFLLTFNLIIASSYRFDNVMKLAHERFYTIAVGCALCLVMSLLVFPNWSGQALHDSTAVKFDGLAISIQDCVSSYFKEFESDSKQDDSSDSEDSVYMGYKAVLDSKSNDEKLALHARWEPRHSRHRFPWQQYVKVGSVLRQFSYTVVSLHGCLKTQIQVPNRIRVLFKDQCIRVSEEVSKVLKELGQSIRTRSQFSPEHLSEHLNKALHDLNKAIETQPRLFLGTNNHQNMLAFAEDIIEEKKNLLVKKSVSLTKSETDGKWMDQKVKERKEMRKIDISSLEFFEALPFAAFVSLLVELVVKLDQVIEEVVELGKVGRFKEYIACDDDHVVIGCENDG